MTDFLISSKMINHNFLIFGSPKMELVNLPRDVIGEFFEFSDLISFINLSKTCRSFRDISRSFRMTKLFQEKFLPQVIEKKFLFWMRKRFLMRNEDLRKLKNTILTGSFLLSCIHNEEYKGQDIDLYSLYSKYERNLGASCEFTKLLGRNISELNQKNSSIIPEWDQSDQEDLFFQGLRNRFDCKKLDSRTIFNSKKQEQIFNFFRTNGFSPVFFKLTLNEIDLPYQMDSKKKGYWNSGISDFIVTLKEIELSSNMRLQVIETLVTPEQCVPFFDFDFCKVYYHFGDQKIHYLNESAVRSKTHEGPIDKDRTSEGRKEKYEKRGYRFI